MEGLFKVIVYVLAIIGGLGTILKVMQLSTTAHIWWTTFIEYVSGKIKLKTLRKSAIKNQIETIVNTTVFDLQKELPYSWVKRMRIKWVDSGNIKRLNDGQYIIRIQPTVLQDDNIINGVYHYFHHSLFPSTYEIVPPRVLNALALRLGHRTIANNPKSKFLINRYEKTLIEREVQLDGQILMFLEPFSELDNRGFLTGALIREIDTVASKIRFSERRNSFEKEIINTMNHMLEFAKKLPNAPEHLWYYDNHTHTFKFLLARKTNRNKIDIYIKRVTQAYNDNVDRIYVFGSNADIDFTSKLIRRINKGSHYQHSETFDLDKDFRTNKKGLGALFLRRQTTANNAQPPAGEGSIP